MFRPTNLCLIQFHPYSLTMQSRFRFKPKEDTDNFRRLMDCTTFPVDWIGAPLTGSLSRHGDHWTHFLTCAHCLAPWEYPNFYPPVGSTKWVSKLTMEDTMNTVRVVDKHGVAIHKHFTCRQTQYVHVNKKLDLAVFHPDQSGPRRGEEKMMWIQNEGWLKRPRLEINDELNPGDEVRIYGFQAHEEGLLDNSETPKEPLMMPIGIKGFVKSLEQDHFFIQPHVDEPEILMGLCGAPVMRAGKCVGMLTAKVHELSPNKSLAGTAMCTYAHDIRSFLLEVEKQMRNTLPKMQTHRHDYKNWDEGDGFQIARHLPVSLNNDTGIARQRHQYLKSEEDPTKNDPDAMWYQQGGLYNQETQENMGVHMADSRIGEKPKNSESIFGESNFTPRGLRDDPNGSVKNYYQTEERSSHWSESPSSFEKEMEEFTEGTPSHPSEMERLKRNLVKLRERRQGEEFQSMASRNYSRTGQTLAERPTTGLSGSDSKEEVAHHDTAEPESDLTPHQARMMARKVARKKAEAMREKERAAKDQRIASRALQLREIL